VPNKIGTLSVTLHDKLCMKLGHSREVQRDEEMADGYSCEMWSLVPYGKVIWSWHVFRQHNNTSCDQHMSFTKVSALPASPLTIHLMTVRSLNDLRSLNDCNVT
jgi:hypothetical protein